MFIPKLIVNNNERWLTNLHYEYFCPVKEDEEFYRKYLQLNFPYQFSDADELFPHHKCNIPQVKPSIKDEALQREAMERSESDFYQAAFNSPDSPKEIYYNELTKLRYDNGLDHGIIPNLHRNYDRFLRPQEAIGKQTEYNPVGGIFHLELNVSSNDDFFYQWMLSGQMKDGRIEFYEGDGDMAFKIQFWDCFCVGIGEQMSSTGNAAMTMQMRLSPAITQNRNVRHEKPWKVTDLNQKKQSSVNSPVETKQLLAKKLEGPFTEDGKKAEELIVGTTYLYKVTTYNNGDGHKLNDTRWSAELNNSGKLKKLSSANAFEQDGVICYKYTPEKADNIRIYAWCNEASKDVSVEVPVVSFPICVDRVNLPGLNRDLSDIADDLAYGNGKVLTRPIYSKSLIDNYKSEYIKNGFDYLGKHSLFANAENEKYPIKAIYSEQQMADTEVKLFGKDWMEWYDSGDDIMKYKSQEKYSDEKLFRIFKDKAKFWFAKGKLDGNIERMIDKFQENTGGVYEDQALSNALINSPNMKLYCDNVQDYIAKRLKERNGLILKNIDGTNPLLDETIYLILDKNSQEARRKIGKTTSVPREDGKGNCFFFRPIFGSKEDRTKGTQIATNDIWSTEVKITNITIKNGDYTIDYHVNLWDHFGLDIGDMEAMPNIVPFAKDTFAVWFVLQHLRGYKPFVTKVEFDKSFKINLNKGINARAIDRNS